MFYYINQHEISSLSPIWAYMIKNTRKRKDKKQCLLLSQELENCNTKYFDIIAIIVSKNSMSRQFLSNFCFSTQIWIELWILERLRWKKRNVLCEVIPVHQLFTATWRYVNRREKYLCLHRLRHCQWCRSCLLRRLKQQKTENLVEIMKRRAPVQHAVLHTEHYS